MLNFRHSDRSRGQIRAVDEVPEYVFSSLVADGKPLDFRSLPEPDDEPSDERTDEFRRYLEQAKRIDSEYISALKGLDPDDDGRQERRVERALRDRVRAQLGMRPWRPGTVLSIAEHARKNGVEPSYDLPNPVHAPATPPAKHTDSYLQTLLLPESMEARVRSVAGHARLAEQETGVSTLYCAFGFLEWYESRDSDQAFFAPLLLHPVSIEKRKVRNRDVYTVRSVEERPETNLSLLARLQHDFGRQLPQFNSETPDPVGAYFRQVEQLVADLPRWRLRRFMTIANFAFARIAMYQDLESQNWPEDRRAESSALIQSILRGADAGVATTPFAEEYDIDDERVVSTAPILIRDADSSQHSAIVDVMKRRNLVIEGPPGTGKSQTITNIIANALHSGLSVLFVAEKMAALEVVKNRLEDSSLGDFCLELHSAKARSKLVVESLKARYEMTKPRVPLDIEGALNEAKRLKNDLSSYATALNTPFGDAGMSVHKLIWMERSASDIGEMYRAAVKDVHIASALKVDQSGLQHRRDVLSHLCRLATEYEAEHSPLVHSPWRFVSNHQIDPFSLEQLTDSIEAAYECLTALAPIVAAVAQSTGTQMPETVESLSKWASRLSSFPFRIGRSGPIYWRTCWIRVTGMNSVNSRVICRGSRKWIEHSPIRSA